jgi:hypothetical protein
MIDKSNDGDSFDESLCNVAQKLFLASKFFVLHYTIPILGGFHGIIPIIGSYQQYKK